MNSPYYVTNAAMNSGVTTNSRTIYVPLGWTPGQIAIIQAICESTSMDIATPSGWELIDSFTQNGDTAGAWYWRRLDASYSSGSQTITRTSTTGQFSIVVSTWAACYQWGTPFESAGVNKGTTNSATSKSITPTRDYCTVACFISVEDDVSIGALAGGNYLERYDLGTTNGGGAELAVDSFSQTTAANEASRASTLGGTDSWGTLTLAFYPSTSINKINGVYVNSFSTVSGV